MIIETELGYTELKTDEIEINDKFDIVLHIIYPHEIDKVIDILEKTINTLDLGTNKEVTIHQISNIRNKLKTIIPHRAKRGLINVGGYALNWLYGTMDDDDRQNIENHLRIVEKNNHNLNLKIYV